MMDIDAVLAEIGEFGRFQRLLYVACSCGWIVGAMQTLLSVFTDRVSDWHCVAACDSHADPGCTPVLFPGCNLTDHSDLQAACAFPPSAWGFDAMDDTTTAQFGLACDRDWLRSVAPAVFFSGYFVGCGVFGWFADRYGRLRGVATSAVLTLVASLACTVAPTFAAFAAARGFVGIGAGGFGLTAYVLGNEFIGPGYRSAAGTMSSAFFSVGVVVLAGAAYIVRSWKPLTLAVGLCVLPYILLPLVAPESPRWLLSQGREREALEGGWCTCSPPLRLLTPSPDCAVLARVARFNCRSLHLHALRSGSVGVAAEGSGSTPSSHSSTSAHAPDSTPELPLTPAPSAASALLHHAELRRRLTIMLRACGAVCNGIE